jgi:hypothetical protein
MPWAKFEMQLKARVTANEKVKAHLSSYVNRIKGQDGRTYLLGAKERVGD